MYMLLFYLLSRPDIFCLFLNYVPRSNENEQAMIYNTLHRKLKIEQHKPYKKQVWIQVLRKGRQILIH